MSFGEFIRKHRLLSGYKSQRRLADKSAISSATISRIESKVQKPEVATLRVLASFLTSTTFSELMNVCGYIQNESSEEKWILFGEEMDRKGLTPEMLYKIIGSNYPAYK